jgi:hypothetical protein
VFRRLQTRFAHRRWSRIVGAKIVSPLSMAYCPRRRFVRGDDPNAAQFLVDCARRGGHVLTHRLKMLAIAPFQMVRPNISAAIRDRRSNPEIMAVVQVGQQRANAGRERRTRLRPCRSLGAVASATAPAATTEQLHLRYDRPDRGQVDMIVAMPAAMGDARHIRPAMTAASATMRLVLSGVSVSGWVLPSRAGCGSQ